MKQSASQLATILMERLGHKLQTWGKTEMGYDITTCNWCGHRYYIEPDPQYISLFTENMFKITKWEKTFIPAQHDINSFVRRVMQQYPGLVCQRLQVMV